MRVAAILACAITVVLGNDSSVVELNDNGCPTNPAIKKQLPHETYCDMFYLCSDGKLVEFHCPWNLMYNEKIEQCDYSWNVNCGGKNKSESKPPQEDIAVTESNEDGDDSTCNSDPSKAPEICAQPENDGALVAHDSCNFFFKCSHGNAVALRCPRTTGYNACKKRCDWLENFDCGNRTMSDDSDVSDEYVGGEEEHVEPDDNNYVDAEAVCAQEDSDGVLVPHDHCNMFYICSDGLPKAQTCPRNTKFNPVKNLCDWSQNVNCGNKTTLEIADNDDGSDNGDPEQEVAEPDDNNHVDAEAVCAQEDSDGILVAHEFCNWFYSCYDRLPYAQVCPPGTKFNPRKEECDWPENVNCGNKTELEPEPQENDSSSTTESVINGPINDDPAQASKICAQDGSDGVLVAHELCNRFVICADRQTTVMRCSVGLLYNPLKERCDWPENVNCGNRTIPDPENDIDTTTVSNDDKEDESIGPVNANPAEAQAVCAQEESDGALIANENCNKYYICVANVPVTMKCSNGLNFNTDTARCDWPENVNCGNRTASMDNDTESDTEKPVNDNPAKAPEICARDGSNGVLIAHENCNQYYKCYAGVPNELSCSRNLLYDVEKEWCDWAETVDCGDRVKPETNSNNDNPSDASEICAQAQSDGVLVAHENCNQYYKCSHGVPVALECSSGLLYNSALGFCDWKQNVDCGERQQLSQ